MRSLHPPLVVVAFAVYYAYAQVQHQCCCGCPLSPCPLNLSKECGPEPLLPCSYFKTSPKFLPSCTVLMGGTEPPSTTIYDFVPIEKHAETTPSGIEQHRSSAATEQFDPLQGAPQTPQMAPSQPLPMVPVAPLGKIAPGVSPQMSLVIPLGIRPETVQQVGGMVGRIVDSVRDFIGAMAWGPPVPEPIVTRFKRKTPHGDASDDNA